MKIKASVFIISFLIPMALHANFFSCQLSNGINVNTRQHVLKICKNGTVINTFKVAIGYNGAGKRRVGDNKTPLGLYNLAYPRRSANFDIFIPILYPTAKQAAAGYTGRDVGIHGPEQTSKMLNWLDNLPMATRGCIAVGKNNYIEYVAKWVKSNPGTKILIV